ncbi:hypothetical protein HHI36_013523 [Cryptolaemus montrouzieri]|uniref:BRISC and BRCA1-A complex member 2 n=1 Tax=Cryptolaemus montrouzieri TaxID=559131 RepID=A0ABD2NHV2_9CUCU
MKKLPNVKQNSEKFEDVDFHLLIILVLYQAAKNRIFGRMLPAGFILDSSDLNYTYPQFRFSLDNFLKLCRDGRIGLVPISINNISRLQTKLIDSKYAYHFKLQIPYAGKNLGWEIIFDPEDLEFAPDFDFSDDGFPQFSNVDDITEEIPTLANWNLENSTSLEAVLKEFLHLYRKYQIKELSVNNIYSRILDEYQLLMSLQDIAPSDIELLIDTNTVQFLISIKVDISRIPEYIQEPDENGSLLNPKEDFALLFLLFHKLDASRVSVELQLSPRLDQLIGNTKTLRIPNYKKDESSLVEFVPLITSLIQQQVDKVAFHYQFKKEFATSLVALRQTSIIEYDSFSFNKITFLSMVENYYVLVQVIIGEEFPSEKPFVKLSSLYCSNPKSKVPCERTLEYKYMPNLPADEMAKYLLDQLKKAIPEFEMHSHSGSGNERLNVSFK